MRALGKYSEDQKLTKTALSEKEVEAQVHLEKDVDYNSQANLGVSELEALGGPVLAILCSNLDDNSKLRLPERNLRRATPSGASIP